MLTGISPFARHTTADTLANIRGTPPDYALLPPNTPSPIRHLIRRCLERDRKRRWQHIGDARIELEETLSTSEVGGSTGRSDSVAAAGTAGGRVRPRLLWIAAPAIVVVAVAAFFGALVAWTTTTTRDTEEYVDITTPPTTRPESLAFSPNGLTLAFVASSEGKSRLWLRHLEQPCPSGSPRNRKRCVPVLVSEQP